MKSNATLQWILFRLILSWMQWLYDYLKKCYGLLYCTSQKNYSRYQKRQVKLKIVYKQKEII